MVAILAGSLRRLSCLTSCCFVASPDADLNRIARRAVALYGMADIGSRYWGAVWIDQSARTMRLMRLDTTDPIDASDSHAAHSDSDGARPDRVRPVGRVPGERGRGVRCGRHRPGL